MEENMSKEIIAFSQTKEKLTPIIKSRKTQVANGAEDVIEPPVDFDEIIKYSYSNAYHMRCIEIKVQNIVKVLKIENESKQFFEDIIEEDTFMELLEYILTDSICAFCC